MKTLEERFWEKVDKSSDCWLWTASTNRKGYGQISQGRRGLRPLQSHRVSWEIRFGEIPEGMCVCHKCDNPSCVNPDHLFLGTIQDNDADRDRKGRTRQGSKHRNAKITEEQVTYSRREYWISGRTVKEIADELGITPGGLHKAVIGETWKAVPFEDDVNQKRTARILAEL